MIFLFQHSWWSKSPYLLCTPQESGADCRMMQSVGRRYVQYFNHQYQRSGTLWGGRYRSCLVQAELYLFEVNRYIELNSVRAQMVDDSGEYGWSSYQINVLGNDSDLCTPRPHYMELGKRKETRLKKYRALFEADVEKDLLTEIRDGVYKGMTLGNDQFKDGVEDLTGRRLRPKKVGRPVGWRKEKEKKVF